jgi:hypothetical protein
MLIGNALELASDLSEVANLDDLAPGRIFVVVFCLYGAAAWANLLSGLFAAPSRRGIRGRAFFRGRTHSFVPFAQVAVLAV